MLNPSIEILNIRVDEPITTLTDLIVSAVCFYAWYNLRTPSKSNETIALFSWFFMLMGIATFLGGMLGHAFLYAVSFPWKLPGWIISMLSINVIERAMIKYSSPLMNTNISRFFSRFNVLELLIFAGLAFGTLNFRYVEIHSAYGIMVFVLGFSLYNKFKGNTKPEINNLIIGVAFAILAAVIFTLQIGVSEWFNHIDISHLLMACTAGSFYLAALKISEDQA